MATNYLGDVHWLARQLIGRRISELTGQLKRERENETRSVIQTQITDLFVQRDSLSSTDRAGLERAIRTHAVSPEHAERVIRIIAEFDQEFDQPDRPQRSEL